MGNGRQSIRGDEAGKEHEGRGMRRTAEPVMRLFRQHSRGEGAPGFAALEPVHSLPVFLLAGIGKDRPMAKGPGANFAAAFKPCNHPIGGQILGRLPRRVHATFNVNMLLFGGKRRIDLILAVGTAKIWGDQMMIVCPVGGRQRLIQNIVVEP